MDIEFASLLGSLAITGGSLVGFFMTKGAGFGAYNTSLLIILTVLGLTGLMFVAGRLDGQIASNILSAVIGFAAGLVAKKDTT